MSISDAEIFRQQFEKIGVETVRLMVANHRYPHQCEMEAIKWLGEKDAELHSRSESARAEELGIARAARDAAFEANSLAASANAPAESANEIARDASASARRSAEAARVNAEAARTNNIIATLALIAAIIAIAMSTFGMFIKR